MFRFLKYLLILLILGALGLWGYSYVMEPGAAPPPQSISIDAS